MSDYPNLLKLPFPGRERCFVFISHWEDKEARRDYDGDQLRFKLSTSFVYYRADDQLAIEWEPQYGPIQRFTRGEEGEWYTYLSDDSKEKARPHYIFPFVRPYGLDWSQCAVGDNQLQQKLARGDYDLIFDVLQRWAQED